MTDKIRFQQTSKSEWLVLLDDEPMGFVFRGRAINARQHLWYAFDLGYESLGMEHFRRTDAVGDILDHYNRNPRKARAHDGHH